MSRASVILVLGSTASGKSALAMELARGLKGQAQIVSADSMQIYRGMDIGTAKATPAQQQEVRHHMIDVADPFADRYSVEDWRSGALSAIQKVHASGEVAIVVGGTNLYVQALISGLFEGPPRDERLREELGRESLEELRERLNQADPVAALRIHPNDRRRSIRAIEVALATGKPISSLQTQWSPTAATLPSGWRCVGLVPDAKSSARSINMRVAQMMDAGFVEEVRGLLAKGPLGMQAEQAVGYREVSMHLRGELTLHDAAEATKIKTRRLARQQRTWLKRFRTIEGSMWFTTPPGETPISEIAQVVLGRQ